MGIHTSPITTNISPIDMHAEATERGTSATASDRSRKRSPPTTDIRDPITKTMMDLWRKAQPGVTAARESGSGLGAQLPLSPNDSIAALQKKYTCRCFVLSTVRGFNRWSLTYPSPFLSQGLTQLLPAGIPVALTVWWMAG